MDLLLAAGADPNAPLAGGETPLMAAAGIGCLAPGEEAGTEDEAIEAIKLLLDRGADLDTVDRNGETAMHGAASKSFPGVVQFIADRGSKVATWDRPNRHGWTPLAIAEGHRPGNFKPAPATSAALRHVLATAAGVTPPPAP